MVSYGLSLLAGILTSLSPCVLPALPLIVGSAAEEHRHAPLAVAGGMVFTFTLFGVFLSSAGLSLGLDSQAVARIAAGGLVLFGAVLLVPAAQEKFRALLAPLAGFGDHRLATGGFKGLTGQFGLGCLLGAVWTPCAGPTLGAAFSLAARGQGMAEAAGIMCVFALGAALPLLMIAYGARKVFASWRDRLVRIGLAAKPLFGLVILGVGAAILTGLDKTAEARILEALPAAWVDLISRY